MNDPGDDPGSGAVSADETRPSGGILGRRLSALAAPLLVAVAVQSVGNLLYHAVVGRALPADQYGALGAVLAAMTLVAVPLSALQTAAARTTAAHGLTAATARKAMLTTALGCAPFVVAVAVAAPVIQSYLHLDNVWDALILAPTLLVASVIAIARGLLLGAGRTTMVAGSYLVAVAVRLGPGLLLAMVYGVTGALVGTLLGEIAGLLVVLIPGLRSGRGLAEPVPLRDIVRTGVVVAGLFTFTTVDLFLARHFLLGAESGGYVAAATIGKTVLALPAAALSVAYPRLVAGYPLPGRFASLRSALLVVGVPAVAGAAVVAALPTLVLTVLYGSEAFPGAAPVVSVLALVAGLSAFVSVFAHAGLARRSWTAFIPWAGAVLEIGLIEWRHDSAVQVAIGSAIALAVTLVVIAVVEGAAWRSSPAETQAAAQSTE